MLVMVVVVVNVLVHEVDGKVLFEAAFQGGWRFGGARLDRNV